MMALHKPYFFIKEKDGGGHFVGHNCNGNLDFCSTTDIDEQTYRLINFAIEEGKRRKAEDIVQLLGLGG